LIFREDHDDYQSSYTSESENMKKSILARTKNHGLVAKTKKKRMVKQDEFVVGSSRSMKGENEEEDSEEDDSFSWRETTENLGVWGKRKREGIEAGKEEKKKRRLEQVIVSIPDSKMVRKRVEKKEKNDREIPKQLRPK
jgi:hypothetical protein